MLVYQRVYKHHITISNYVLFMENHVQPEGTNCPFPLNMISDDPLCLPSFHLRHRSWSSQQYPAPSGGLEMQSLNCCPGSVYGICIYIYITIYLYLYIYIYHYIPTWLGNFLGKCRSIFYTWSIWVINEGFCKDIKKHHETYRIVFLAHPHFIESLVYPLVMTNITMENHHL